MACPPGCRVRWQQPAFIPNKSRPSLSILSAVEIIKLTLPRRRWWRQHLRLCLSSLIVTVKFQFHLGASYPAKLGFRVAPLGSGRA